MNVKEQGSLMIVTELPAAEVSESLDHAAPVAQMEAIDSVMRFYFGAAGWLTMRNKQQPGLNPPIGPAEAVDHRV